MFKMPIFPKGTTFWGAEGGAIPVAKVPMPGGGSKVTRYDTNPPGAQTVSMLGAVPLLKEEFEGMVQKFQSPEHIKQAEAQKKAREAEWDKRLSKYSPKEKAERIKAALAQCKQEKEDEKRKDRL
jgi:hypothetical protein